MQKLGFSAQYDTNKIAEHLTILLASTEHFYLIYKHYHWNLIDPRFYQLHLLFDKHADELHDQVDIIAERMRQMDQVATGDLGKYMDLTILNNELKEGDNAQEILEHIVHNHDLYIELVETIIDFGGEQKDYATVDYATDILHIAQQQRWFIAAHQKSVDN